MSTSDDAVAKILLDAVDIIRDRGWMQGDYDAPDGRVDALGALCAAAGKTPWSWATQWQLPPALIEAVALLESTLSTPTDVVGWNDTLGRTEAEVVAALRAAAARAEGGERP